MGIQDVVGEKLGLNGTIYRNLQMFGGKNGGFNCRVNPIQKIGKKILYTQATILTLVVLMIFQGTLLFHLFLGPLKFRCSSSDDVDRGVLI